MNLYNILIYVTFFVKVSFLFTLIYLRYVKTKQPKNLILQAKLTTIKEQLDFVFIWLMSLILIINFNPYVKFIQIDPETKMLFFLYGIIMIFTANYSFFESNSIILHNTYISLDLSSNSFSLLN